MKNYASLRKVIAIIGLFLVAISLYCSFLLYTSFSSTLSNKAAWGGMGLGLDLFKNVALLAALALWSVGSFASRTLSIVVSLAYLILTSISFMAFFGFMSTVQHQFEREAVLAGNKYRSLQTSLKNAENAVEALSRYADLSMVQQARAKIEEITPRLEMEKRLMLRYADPNCTPKRNSRGLSFTTKAAEHCARADAIRAELRPWREKTEGYEKYQSALAHQTFLLDEIEKLDAGNVEVSQNTLHPMFNDLGKLLAKAPDEMKVAFMFISSFSAEVLGTLSILIAIILGRTRSFTLDEIEVLSTQLKGHQERLQHALAFTGATAAAPPLGNDPPKLASESAAAAEKKPELKPGAVEVSNPPEVKEGVIEEPADKNGEEEADETTADGYETKKNSLFVREASVPAIRVVNDLDIDRRFKAVTCAILNGKCPPLVNHLLKRYGMAPGLAGPYLSALADRGHLIFDRQNGQYRLNTVEPDWQPVERQPRCGAIEYEDHGNPVKVFFNTTKAKLPVRLKSGDIAWTHWGRRIRESSDMPPGSSTRLELIHNGKWDSYRPRPVLIPATGHMGKDREGKIHWFSLDKSMLIQGLLAERNNERRIYVVTVESPRKYAHISDRWPNLVEKKRHDSRYGIKSKF
ncbi:MAG: hypothetical protein GY862_38095 [Gammaproteobacteria bacterium]|nr:hypothetical protein [Gammaproteobacteria bacterium]